MTDTPAAIRRKIEAWLREADAAPTVLALHHRPEWAGEPRVAVNGTTVRVVPCATPLAALSALHERADGERLVLLTELDETQLGDGFLAYLSRHRVRTLDPWDLVCQLFGATGPDPALVREKWAAAPLVDLAPADGWPRSPGTVLTRDHALRCLTGALLGLDREQIDGAGLLQWTTRPQQVLGFTRLAGAVAKGLGQFVVEVAGAAAAPIMTTVLNGHGADAISLGLLASVLWSGNGDEQATDVAVAKARLEPQLGRPSHVEATAFGQAAEAWIHRAADADEPDDQAGQLVWRAERIAADVDMTALLRRSDVLPAGFTQRQELLAEAITTALAASGTARDAAIRAAQNALDLLERHRGGEKVQTTTAQMAVRLLRWLATEEAAAPATLHAALLRQVREDGWVDRARLDVFAGDPVPVIGPAYQALHRAVDARRARHDNEFASLLAAVTTADAEPGALLRVEDVLDRVVEPILNTGRQVLLLVLDGMSVAAATELAESVTRNSAWLELTPGGGARTGVLAALPTITEVSRCSLLSGTIAVGAQVEEKRAFASRFPTGRLLHKGSLAGPASNPLPPDVVSAVEDPAVPVVAAVVNTIDDALDRSDPGTAEWNRETIRAIGALLAVAGSRVVVITSDHGHVIDRGPEAQIRSFSGGGNRWRPASSPAGDGEVAVSGRRVAKGNGSVVLPWQEELRFGPRKAGYHGGASPAEAVIPLMIFSPGDEQAVPGWSGAPVSSPAWWRELLPDTSTEVGAPPSPVRPRPSRRTPPPPADGLFELPAEPPVTAAPLPAAASARPSGLVASLLASDAYQQRRLSRAQLPDERVAAMLGALLAGGGRATMDTLAARAGIPVHRIRGAVTALQRVLQVEGYPVLDLDSDGRTIILDRSLLIDQFGLSDT